MASAECRLLDRDRDLGAERDLWDERLERDDDRDRDDRDDREWIDDALTPGLDGGLTSIGPLSPLDDMVVVQRCNYDN